MDNLITAGIAVLAGGGGLFALAKYVLNKLTEIQKNHIDAVQKQQEAFLGYIETKNGTTEKVAKAFIEHLEARDKRFEEILSEALRRK